MNDDRNEVDFRRWFDSFFSWSELDFDRNYRRIKTLYLKEYEKYCKHIGQQNLVGVK